jgi:O-acetyl-ADP-ribose deacetylase (regulator of RNase III)
MKEHNLPIIAFSSISTGALCYPIIFATRMALNMVHQWIDEGDNRDLVDHIVFCVFTYHLHNTYLEQAPRYFPSTADTDPGFSTWLYYNGG